MVRAKKHPRKAAFKAALALAGVTANDWCAERGITRSHLSQVLRGVRESGKLVADVDAFIAKHAPSIHQTSAA